MFRNDAGFLRSLINYVTYLEDKFRTCGKMMNHDEIKQLFFFVYSTDYI